MRGKSNRGGEPERPEPHDLAGAGARAILFILQEPERPEPHDLARAGAGAILFFFQDPEREHFKKLEWSRSWSQSWHKLVRLQAPAVFKNFVKTNNS